MKRKELEPKTKSELLEMARKLDLPGRSGLTKDELIRALTRYRGRARKPTTVRPSTPRVTAKKRAPKKTAKPSVAAQRTTRRRTQSGGRRDARRDMHKLSGAPLAMPERYDRDHLGLMVRDPYWLHAYWEVTVGTRERTRAQLGSEWEGHKPILRVYAYPAEVDPKNLQDGQEEDRYDVELPNDATSWYINVGRSDGLYRVAIGVLTRAGDFRPFVESNAVRTPRGGCSAVTDTEWARHPDVFGRLAEMLESGSVPGSSAALGMPPYERPAHMDLPKESKRRKTRQGTTEPSKRGKARRGTTGPTKARR
jgi:hypothetical protein